MHRRIARQFIASITEHLLLIVSCTLFGTWLLFSGSPFQSSIFRSNVSAQTEPSSSLFFPLFIDNTRSIQLSEFMASNQATLVDEDGDTPDWIELYNPTDLPVDMTGWSLTDNRNELTRWRFPAVVIPPGDYLVVMASGKNRTVVGNELHTNFKLDQSGEYLALVEPDGLSIATYYDKYPQQYQDRSFGLSADGFGSQLLTSPTPGSKNTNRLVYANLAIDVHHEPALLNPGEPLTIVVAVTSPSQAEQSLSIGDAAESTAVDVTLHYRVMYENEVDLRMWDDGAHGDGAAGDGIYAVTIPGDILHNLANPGDMIRYAVTVQTADGSEHRHPHFLSPTDSAEYFGTIVEDAQSSSAQPILHWFTETPARANTRSGTRASLYFDGTFYDNILAHVRGGISVGYPKKGFKFVFNHPQPFTLYSSPEKFRTTSQKAEMGQNFSGQVYLARTIQSSAVDATDNLTLQVSEFNLSTTYSDKAYIRQPLAFDVYRDAGVPAPISFPVRVQQNGDFHMVSIFVEHPNETFLERNNLDPDGALYKMFNPLLPSRLDKVEKKTRKEEGNDDLLALATALTELKGDALAQFLVENVDLPQVINYLAVSNIIQQNDHMSHNYYLYRDSDGTGLWSILPWDEDFTFGRSLIEDKDDIDNDNNKTELLYLQDEIWANHELASHPLFGGFEQTIYRNGNYLYDAILRTPQTRELYLRRLRTLMDQFLQPPETPVEQRYFETKIDALYQRMAADILLDAERWPIEWGVPQTFAQAIDILKRDYLDARRIHLYGTHVAENAGIIPAQQPTRTPITFEHFQFNSAGLIEANLVNGTSIDMSQDLVREQEFFTLLNPAPYAVDLSGWQVTQNDHDDDNMRDLEQGSVSIKFAHGTVIPAGGTLCIPADAATFRQNIADLTFQQENTLLDCLIANAYRGALSQRAGSIVLKNSREQTVDQALYMETSLYADSLIVSELNFKATIDSEAATSRTEFVEITNIDTKSIHIGQFHFSAGIDFTFPDNTQIGAGESIVLVENVADFTRQYADTLYSTATVVGVYDGSLSDEGETLTLLDQAGHLVALLTYNDRLVANADLATDGYTLNRRQPFIDYHIACGWVASDEPLGTPGVYALSEDFSCRPAAYLPFATIQ